ncbi:hypothetical protein JCM10212_001381 [Sporobolomyces blumeae]
MANGECDSDCDPSSDVPLVERVGLAPSCTTVLFDPSDSFKTPDAFFDECDKRLRKAIGIAAHRHSTHAGNATMACSRRTNRMMDRGPCPFRVKIVTTDEGTWRVAADASRWKHNHGSARILRSRQAKQSSSALAVLDWDDEELRYISDPDDADYRTTESDDSSEDESTPAQSQRRGQNPGWTLKTRSTEIRTVIAQRETIFAKQRSFAAFPDRQKASHVPVNDHLASLSISTGYGRGPLRWLHDIYLDFAESNRIPPFPITPPIIALWLVSRVAKRNGNYKSSLAWARRAMLLTACVWDHSTTYNELQAWPGAEAGIRQFVHERENVRQRGPRARNRLPSAAVTRPQPRVSPSQNDLDGCVSSASELSELTPSGSEDEDSDEESEGPTFGGGSDRVEGLRPTATDMPVPGDSFDSVTAAYCHVLQKTVPSLGYAVVRYTAGKDVVNLRCSLYRNSHGARCPFFIGLRVRDDGKCVVRNATAPRHTHGPHPKRLQDPAWLPTLRNADARKCFGLPPLDAFTPDSKRPLSSSPWESAPARPAKRSRRDEDEQGVSASSPEPVAPPESSSLPHLARPFSLPVPTASTSQRGPEAGVDRSKPDGSSRLVELNAKPIPLARSTIRADDEAHLSLSTVTSFLVGLDPSLAPLAEPFYRIGFRTLSSLGHLAAFDPTTLDLLLDELESQDAARVDGGTVALVKEKLAEARTSGWKAS